MKTKHYVLREKNILFFKR